MAHIKEVDIYNNTNGTRVYIHQCHKKHGAKTFIYGIRKDDKTGLAHWLGHISWYGAWRGYAFYPTESSCWNDSCMDGISAFIKKINKRHRERLKK